MKLIQVDHDRHDDHTRRFYTADWRPLGVRQGYPLAPVIEAPPGLEAMTAWARRLGERFDFIRIDFYDLDGDVYLGEMTPYPESGLLPFVPASFDDELGDAWTLPALG